MSLLPERLEDWICEDNPVRVIDVFVDALDLVECGFERTPCTTGKERRITRWEHEHLIDEATARMERGPNLMRTRHCTVEHPPGTLKALMEPSLFLTRGLKNVGAEMALNVLAYNIKRMINLIGIGSLMKAIKV